MKVDRFFNSMFAGGSAGMAFYSVVSGKPDNAIYFWLIIAAIFIK